MQEAHFWLQLLPSPMETYEKACVEGCCVEVQSLLDNPGWGRGTVSLGVDLCVGADFKEILGRF